MGKPRRKISIQEAFGIDERRTMKVGANGTESFEEMFGEPRNFPSMNRRLDVAMPLVGNRPAVPEPELADQTTQVVQPKSPEQEVQEVPKPVEEEEQKLTPAAQALEGLSSTRPKDWFETRNKLDVPEDSPIREPANIVKELMNEGIIKDYPKTEQEYLSLPRTEEQKKQLKLLNAVGILRGLPNSREEIAAYNSKDPLQTYPAEVKRTLANKFSTYGFPVDVDDPDAVGRAKIEVDKILDQKETQVYADHGTTVNTGSGGPLGSNAETILSDEGERKLLELAKEREELEKNVMIATKQNVIAKYPDGDAKFLGGEVFRYTQPIEFSKLLEEGETPILSKQATQTGLSLTIEELLRQAEKLEHDPTLQTNRAKQERFLELHKQIDETASEIDNLNEQFPEVRKMEISQIIIEMHNKQKGGNLTIADQRKYTDQIVNSNADPKDKDLAVQMLKEDEIKAQEYIAKGVGGLNNNLNRFPSSRFWNVNFNATDKLGAAIGGVFEGSARGIRDITGFSSFKEQIEEQEKDKLTLKGYELEGRSFFGRDNITDINPNSPTFTQQIVNPERGKIQWSNFGYNMAEMGGQLTGQIAEGMLFGGILGKIGKAGKFLAEGINIGRRGVPLMTSIESARAAQKAYAGMAELSGKALEAGLERGAKAGAFATEGLISPASQWALRNPESLMDMAKVVVPAFLMSYDHNFKHSIDLFGVKEPWKNRVYAITTSALEGATEMIGNPFHQLKLIKGFSPELARENIFKFIKNLSKEQADDMGDAIGLKQKLVNALKLSFKQGGEALKEMSQEGLEEVLSNAGEFLTSFLLSPRTIDDRNLGRETYETFVQTFMGMGFMGAGAVKNMAIDSYGVFQNKHYKDAILGTARNAESLLSYVKELRDTGQLTEDEYKDKVEYIKVAQNQYSQMPLVNMINGFSLSQDDMSNYMYARTNEYFIDKKLRGATADQQDALLEKRKKFSALKNQALKSGDITYNTNGIPMVVMQELPPTYHTNPEIIALENQRIEDNNVIAKIHASGNDAVAMAEASDKQKELNDALFNILKNDPQTEQFEIFEQQKKDKLFEESIASMPLQQLEGIDKKGLPKSQQSILAARISEEKAKANRQVTHNSDAVSDAEVEFAKKELAKQKLQAEADKANAIAEAEAKKQASMKMAQQLGLTPPPPGDAAPKAKGKPAAPPKQAKPAAPATPADVAKQLQAQSAPTTDKSTLVDRMYGATPPVSTAPAVAPEDMEHLSPKRQEDRDADFAGIMKHLYDELRRVPTIEDIYDDIRAQFGQERLDKVKDRIDADFARYQDSAKRKLYEGLYGEEEEETEEETELAPEETQTETQEEEPDELPATSMMIPTAMNEQEQIDKAHDVFDDTIDSELPTVDRRNPIKWLGRKIAEARRKLAFRNLEYVERETKDGKREFKTVNINTLHAKDILDWVKFKAGTKLTIRIKPDSMVYDWDTNIESGIDVANPSKREIHFSQYVAANNLTEGDPGWIDKVPIQVLDANGNVIQELFIHTPDWYNPSNVADVENQDEIIKESQEMVRALRNQAYEAYKQNKDFGIEIASRSYGTKEIIDHNQDPSTLPTMTANNPQSLIGFVTGTNTVFANGQVIEAEDILGFDSYSMGSPVELRLVGEGKYIAVPPIYNNHAGSHYVNTTMKSAFAVYLLLNTPKNKAQGFHIGNGKVLTKEEAVAINKKFREKDIDLSQSQGVADYLNSFIHVYHQMPPNREKLPEGFIFAVMDSGRLTVYQNVKVVAKDAKLGDEKVWKDGVGLAGLSITDGVLSLDRIQGILDTMFDRLKSAKMNVMEIKKDRESFAKRFPFIIMGKDGFRHTPYISSNESIKNKEGNSYYDFLKDHMRTNIKSWNIGTTENPNYVTLVQPIIEIKAEGAKDIITTEQTSEEKQEEDVKEATATGELIHVNETETIVIEQEEQTPEQELEQRRIYSLSGEVGNYYQIETEEEEKDHEEFGVKKDQWIGYYWNNNNEDTVVIADSEEELRQAINDKYDEEKAKLQPEAKEEIPVVVVEAKTEAEQTVEIQAKIKELENQRNKELRQVPNVKLGGGAEEFQKQVEARDAKIKEITERYQEQIDKLKTPKQTEEEQENTSNQLIQKSFKILNAFGLQLPSEEHNSPLRLTEAQRIAVTASINTIEGLTEDAKSEIEHFIMATLFKNLNKKYGSRFNQEEYDKLYKNISFADYFGKKLALMKSHRQLMLDHEAKLTKPNLDLIAHIAVLNKHIDDFELIEKEWTGLVNGIKERLNKYVSFREVNFDQEEENNMVNLDGEHERNFDKEGFTENYKNSVSLYVKRFIFTIPEYRNGKVARGFMGVEKYSRFEDNYNILMELIPGGNQFLSGREKISNFLLSDQIPELHRPMAEQVAKLMKKNMQFSNGIQYAMTKSALTMKMVIEEYNRKTKKYKMRLIDINANSAVETTRQQWAANFQISDLVEDDGEIKTIDPVMRDRMINRLEILATAKQFGDKEVDQLEKLLAAMGIKMDTRAIKLLLKEGYFLAGQRGGKPRKVKGKSLFVHKDGTFKILHDFLVATKTAEAKGKSIEDNGALNFFQKEPNSVKRLAKLHNQFAAFVPSQSFRDGEKNIYAYENMMLDKQTILNLKQDNAEGAAARQTKLQTLFDKHSFLLQLMHESKDLRDNIDIHTCGLTSIRVRGKEVFNSAEAKDLSDVDYERLIVSMFTHMDKTLGEVTKEGLPLRMASLISLVSSDKKRRNILYAAVLALKSTHINTQTARIEEGENGDKIREFLFSQLVMPELERIAMHHQQAKETKKHRNSLYNQKDYNLGAQMFLMIPSLNEMTVGETRQPILDYLANLNEYNMDDIVAKIKGEAIQRIEAFVNEEVDAKLEKWKSAGFFVKEEVEGTELQIMQNLSVGVPPKVTKTIRSMDSEYLGAWGSTIDEQMNGAAVDFVVNTLVSTANNYMLFSGDIANFAQDKTFEKDKNDNDLFNRDKDGTVMVHSPLNPQTYTNITKGAIGVNMGKRLAMLIAPGATLADSFGDRYIQIFAQDAERYADNYAMLLKQFYGQEAYDREQEKIAELKFSDEVLSNSKTTADDLAKTAKSKATTLKHLKDTYPKIAAYLKIESTDGQEYTTWKEHLDIIKRQGRIDEEQFHALTYKMANNVELDDKDKETIFQPIKPVYTAVIPEDIGNNTFRNRTLYVKSSSFPLIPQLTQGFELDKLRLDMERLQNGKDGLNVRVGYASATKVGIKLANKKEGRGPIKIWSEDGTYNERAFEFVSISEIHDGTSSEAVKLDRLNFRIQQDVPFKSSKKKLDKIAIGTQMMKILFSNEARRIIGEDSFKHYNDSFITWLNNEKEALYSELKFDPETNRATDGTVQAIKDLLLREAKERNYTKQDIDILNSLLPNNTFEVPLWMAPNSNRYEAFINAIIAAKLISLKLPGTSSVLGAEAGFKQDFLTAKHNNSIVYTDAFSDKLEADQIFIPSKFRTNTGQLIDLSDDKWSELDPVTNRRMLRKGKIEEELMQLMSFRVPTSSHVSGSLQKIAGFFPITSGDLSIYNSMLIKQKGFDYDVDKENTYWLHHFVDITGKITVLNEEKVKETISELETLIDLTPDPKIDNFYKYRKDQLDNFFNQTIIDNDVRSLYRELAGEEGVRRTAIDEIDKELRIEEARLISEDAKKEMKGLLKITKQKLITQLAQNEVIRMHVKVFSHPDMQAKIQQVLSTDFAEEQADLLDELKEDKDTRTFSILSDSYQKYKMDLGATGKTAIGVYSSYLTWHGLNQQTAKPIALVKDGEDAQGNRTDVPMTIRIGNITSDGVFGKLNIIKPSNISDADWAEHVIGISDAFSERQNTATDNEKLQILGRVGVNDDTINVDALLTAQGIVKDLVTDRRTGKKKAISFPYFLLSQPIIADYIKMMENAGSQIADYDQNKKKNIREKIIDKYGGIATLDSLNEDKQLDRNNLTGQVLYDNIQGPVDFKTQVVALDLYLELAAIGEKVRVLQSHLNIQRSKLGKSFFEAQSKIENIERLHTGSAYAAVDLDIPVRISNTGTYVGEFVDSKTAFDLLDEDQKPLYTKIDTELWVKPTTFTGIIMVNATKSYKDIFERYFPQRSTLLNNLIDDIIDDMGKDLTSVAAELPVKYEIMEEMKKYLLSSTLGMHENPQEERKRLMFDEKEGKEFTHLSLAKYLYDLKNDPAWTHIIGLNPLLKQFDYEFDGVGLPSKIKYRNSRGEDLEEEQKYQGLIKLLDDNQSLPKFNGEEYDTTKLVGDLLTYAYVSSPVQAANEFIKYVPIKLLKVIGATEKMRKIHSNLVVNNKNWFELTFGGRGQRFRQQFFQHNPGKAKKLQLEDITNFRKLDDKKMTKFHELVYSFEIKAGRIPPERMPQYVSIYNEKKQGKGNDKYQLYRLSTVDGIQLYKRIPVLGTFGMVEYDANVDIVEPLIDKTQYAEFPRQDIQQPPRAKREPISVKPHGVESGAKVIDILNSIETGNYPGLSSFVGVLKQFIDPATQVIVTDIDADGKYVQRTNTIIIDPNTLSNTANLARVFVKEYVHSISARELSKYFERDGLTTRLKAEYQANGVPSHIARLNNVYSEIYLKLKDTEQFKALEAKMLKTAKKEEGGELSSQEFGMYGAIDIFEFTSEIFGNEDFQKILAATPSDIQGKSLFQRFLDAMNALFRRLGVQEGTMLEEGLIASFEFIEVEYKLKPKELVKDPKLQKRELDAIKTPKPAPSVTAPNIIPATAKVQTPPPNMKGMPASPSPMPGGKGMPVGAMPPPKSSAPRTAPPPPLADTEPLKQTLAEPLASAAEIEAEAKASAERKARMATGKKEFTYKGRTIKTDFVLGEQQVQALEKMIDFINGDIKAKFYTLEGYAGTGKTTIIGYLQKYFAKETNFCYAAPTHAATVQLAFSTVKTGNTMLPVTTPSATYTENGRTVFSKKVKTRLDGLGTKVFVVDEASMLGNYGMEKLVEAAANTGARLIFMGDPKQIQEVVTTPKGQKEKPKHLTKVFSTPNKSVLTDIHRQSDNSFINLLTKIRTNTFAKFYKITDTESVRFMPNADFNKLLIQKFKEAIDRTVYITYKKDDVTKKNRDIRAYLGFEGTVKEGESIIGFAGYANKQVEKGNVANSVTYSMDTVNKTGSYYTVSVKSSKLEELRATGMTGVSQHASTEYYPLAPNENMLFGRDSEEDYKQNNEIICRVFRQVHELNQKYKAKPKQIDYDVYQAQLAQVTGVLANMAIGDDYVYNPQTDRMEKYSKTMHGHLTTEGQGSLKLEKGIDYGYAINIHKSQGLTMDNVFFDIASVQAASKRGQTEILRDGVRFNTEQNSLQYVGMSRASVLLVVDESDLIYPLIDISQGEAIQQETPSNLISVDKSKLEEFDPNETLYGDDLSSEVYDTSTPQPIAEGGLSIATSKVKKEPHWKKDEQMANASNKVIAKQTAPKSSSYRSSTKAYLEVLGGASTEFVPTDKVWVFGAGEWGSVKATIQKDFNEYYKPTIDKAIAQGVTIFNVGNATGIDTLTKQYLESKGFKPTSKGEWNEFSTKETTPTEARTPTEIYNQLPKKTLTKPVFKKPWADLKNMKEAIVVRDGKTVGIVSTRLQGTDQHFGNPFSNNDRAIFSDPSLIRTASTREAVEKYIDWVINSEDERATWIRLQLRSGALKGLPIAYYTELNEPSHANALDYLINKYDWDAFYGEYHLSPRVAPNFTISNSAAQLNLSEEEQIDIYENYVKMMDRKREGKAISYKMYQETVLGKAQVFKQGDTYIFGEWDSRNNIFKGRFLSSPSIGKLYSALDTLLANVDFMASVPSDIGSMLERKGMYKLDVGKAYDFKGEQMIKNLYFNSQQVAERVLGKSVEDITKEDIIRYDTFGNFWGVVSKLTKAYEDKNYNEVYTQLTELGIYDKNAYAIRNRIRDGKITKEEEDKVIAEIIKNAYLNKVNVDKTDYLNDPAIHGQLNNKLNNTLATYLSHFGIKTEMLDDIQEKLGIDSFATVDILNKLISVDKENQTDYPQVAGRLIAYMMQNNPLMTEVKGIMKQHSMYKDLSEEEIQEAIGDLISQDLHKKTNTQLPQSLLEKIALLVRQFLDFIGQHKMDRINRNVGIISDNVLMQNQSLITASMFKPGKEGKALVKISLEEALASDEFAAQIIDDMSPYFILTGSVVLAEQGTVYRPNENQVHDLDWSSPYTREDAIKIFNKLYPEALYVRNIVDKPTGDQTDSWIIAPEGYKIVNLKLSPGKAKSKYNIKTMKLETEAAKIKILGYDIIDKDGNVVSQYIPLSDSHTGKIEAKVIDIFSYPAAKIEQNIAGAKTITLESGTELQVTNWQRVFEAKLKYGRLKDIWDYNRFIPNESIFAPTEPTEQAEEEMVHLSPRVIQEEEDVDKYFNSEEHNSPVQTLPTGKLTHLQDLKKQVLRNVEAKLVKNDAEQKEHRNPSNYRNELLTQERKLKKLKKELEDEIKGLENSVQKTTTTLTPMITSALARAEELVKSVDPKDIAEAGQVARFIKAIAETTPSGITGFFKGIHPIFTLAEIEDLKNNPSEMDILKEWARQAELIIHEVDRINNEILLDAVNSVPNIRKMYGRDLTLEELKVAIKDTDAFSMWTMDIGSGIFSKNGKLPQIAERVLLEAIETAQAKYRIYDERLSNLTPKLEAEMRKLGLTSKLIIAKGLGQRLIWEGIETTPDYSIFFSKNKFGLYSKGLKLVDVLSPEFYTEKARINKIFWERYDASQLEKDPIKAAKQRNKAFDERNQWVRKNEHVFDPATIVSLRNNPKYTNHELLKPYFDEHNMQESQQFEDDMRKLLGDKEFDKRVKQITSYVDDFLQLRELTINNLLTQENKTKVSDLSQKSQRDLKDLEFKENPFYSAKTVITGRPETNKTIYGEFDIPFNSYTLVSTPKNAEHYDENYKKIQANAVLSEFYELAREITEIMKTKFNVDIQNQLFDGSINYMSKSIKGILLDNEGSFFAKMYKIIRKMWHDIISILGSDVNSGLSDAYRDFVNGNKNYRISDAFIRNNLNEIKKIKSVEIAKFQALSGLKDLKNVNVDNLNKKGKDYLETIFGKDAFKPGQKLNMYRTINDYAHHLKVQDSSMNLPKLLKIYSNLTTQFEARNNALPLVENIKNHYNEIKGLESNAWGEELEGQIKGKRERAKSQFESWFERVILDDKGGKYNTTDLTESEQIEASRILGQAVNPITKALPLVKRVYTLKEAKTIKEINRILKGLPKDKVNNIIAAINDPNKTIQQVQLLDKEAGIVSLIKYKHDAGRLPSVSSVGKTLYKFLSLKMLGLNMSSASINFVEGQMSDILAAENGESFTPANIYKITAMDIIAAEFQRKAASMFGKDYADKATPILPWKLAKLIERYDVFSEIAHDIQQSSTENIMDGFISGVAMAPNRYAEYLNQGPMIAAIFEDIKLKSNDPALPDESLLDAMERVKTVNGYVLQLKPQFDTVENRAAYLRETEGLSVKNEKQYSQPYHDLKTKIAETIHKWHGNYGKFKGMKLKENIGGQGIVLMRTFLANQLFVHFAVEQDNINLGVKGFKGIDRSHISTTAFLLGASVAAPFGLIPAGVSGIIGWGINRYLGNKGKRFGSKTGTHFVNDVIITSQLLMKKLIGTPINIAVLMTKPFLPPKGKTALIEAKQKYFNTLTDKAFMHTGGMSFQYTDMFTQMQGTRFTKRDYMNFKSNLRFLTNIMLMYALYFAAYLVYYSEKDPEEEGISDEEREKRKHDQSMLHLLTNQCMKIAGQATSYYNIFELAKTLSFDALSVVRYLGNVADLVKSIGAYLHGYDGEDISLAPETRGESQVLLKTAKILQPNAFSENIYSLGFGKSMKQKWLNLPVDKLWWSDEKVAEHTIEAYRAEAKAALKDSGLTPEEIKAKVKEQVPYKNKNETYLQLLQRVKEQRNAQNAPIRQGSGTEPMELEAPQLEAPQGTEVPDLQPPEAP